MKNTFLLSYIKEINNNVNNWYDNNFDYSRFGLEQKEKSILINLKMLINRFLQKRGYVSSNKCNYLLKESIRFIEPNINEFDWLYNHLADEESKITLLKVLAYRVLGFRKVMLPLNTPEYWQQKEELKSLSDATDFIQIKFNDWKLLLTDLHPIGIPIQLYTVDVYNQFVLEQYRCKGEGIDIGAKFGDYVIDTGGCYGDTALYFSNLVGPEGKIFSYEFVPDNLQVFETNLGLNPHLKSRIEIFQNAAWNKSNKILSFSGNGPGSKIVLDNNKKNIPLSIVTLSIDDLMHQKKIPRIDFIKMDIEGSELNALKGAIKTIKTFKPKLAISIYHQLNDFYEIPLFVDSLNLGYQFYLRHYTIHQEETVLFTEAR